MTWALVLTALLAAGGAGAPPGGEEAGGPAQAADSSWVRTEFWRCPAEGAQRFQRTVEDHWAPIFDSMVAEGLLAGWSVGRPVQERAVDFEGGESALAPELPGWDWIVTWEAESRSAYEAGWPEYHRRLAEVADAPDPGTFCTRVRIVQHGIHRRR